MHISVLLKETIDNLNIEKNKIYVDATLGYGGHSLEILKKLDNTGFLYCFEQDHNIINFTLEKFKDYSNFKIINDNFKNLKERLNENNVFKIDGIIYDLGVSSFQIDTIERGFSYMNDAFLDMRMNQNTNFKAYDIVNTYSEKDLLEIFYKYGEEKYSKNIVRNIIKRRRNSPIKTTLELSNLIINSVPRNYKGHPAKRVFQALRIEVNKELEVFEKSINDALNLLNIEGRALVITFHSLEDRICKHVFKEKTSINIPKNIPIVNYELDFELLFKKPILPSALELEKNPRSHSAKLRGIKRIK